MIYLLYNDFVNVSNEHALERNWKVGRKIDDFYTLRNEAFISLSHVQQSIIMKLTTFVPYDRYKIYNCLAELFTSTKADHNTRL